MASSDNFILDETERFNAAANEVEQRDGSAATTRSAMSDITDGESHATPSASIPTQATTDGASAATGQKRRRSDQSRFEHGGGIRKIRTSRSRRPVSPNTLIDPRRLATFSAYGQPSIPAPPGYGSHVSRGMSGSQLEISVAPQGLDPRQLEQPSESLGSFGPTDNVYNWNEDTLASANNTFGGLQGSFVAAQSTTPPSSFYTGPGPFDIPVHPGSGRVMVELWRNLQAKHSWFFQVETDELQIKFHHTPSTGQHPGMTAFKEKWKQLRDYNLLTLGNVVGDRHAFIRQIAVFNRLLEQPEIDSLLGPNAFRTIATEVMFLNKKLEQARCMTNAEHFSAWKEKHGQATRDVVAKLHDWVLSLRIALPLVHSQDALTGRKMVSYERLTSGEISRLFENLRQPEATVMYLPVE
jgi:hypothetical protein